MVRSRLKAAMKRREQQAKCYNVLPTLNYRTGRAVNKGVIYEQSEESAFRKVAYFFAALIWDGYILFMPPLYIGIDRRLRIRGL